MKQRLMALTIDFKQAFTTVALITVNGTIKGHSGPATLRIVERYMGMIQLIDMKHILQLSDSQTLADEAAMLEYHFNMMGMDGVYCPWAENTSASIDEKVKLPEYFYTRVKRFQHLLYGVAYLVPNSSFKKSNWPTSINYILEGSNDIKDSSLADCGLQVSLQELKDLGY